MGVIVADILNFPTGISVTDYYVNVDHIKISKSNVDSFKYSVECTEHLFATRDARMTGKAAIMVNRIVLTVDTLDNLLTQIYDNIKSKYETYEDVFE